MRGTRMNGLTFNKGALRGKDALVSYAASKPDISEISIVLRCIDQKDLTAVPQRKTYCP